MKRTILILAVLLGSISVSFAQTEYDKLNKAYRLRSQKLLKGFFEEWKNESKPISDSEFAQLNDTIKESYYLFNAVFKEIVATHLKNMNSSFNENNLKFYIVQNELFINKWPKVYYNEDEIDSFIVHQIKNHSKLKDSTKSKFLRRTNGKLSLMMYDNFSPRAIHDYHSYSIKHVKDFRPRVPGVTVLYLNEDYERRIQSFLFNNKQDNDKSIDRALDKRVINKVKRKKRFLEKWTIFLWDELLEFRTIPHIHSIVFDDKLEYAKVYFETYKLDHQYYKKEEGKWILIPSVSEYSY